MADLLDNPFAKISHADLPSVVATRATASPGSSSRQVETYSARVTVMHGLPEIGVTYADDADQNRYFIDRDSLIDFELRRGQVLRAEVNEEGHVLNAKLLRD